MTMKLLTTLVLTPAAIALAAGGLRRVADSAAVNDGSTVLPSSKWTTADRYTVGSTSSPAPAAAAGCSHAAPRSTGALDAAFDVLPALAPRASAEGMTYYAGQDSTLSLVADEASPGSPGSVMRVGFPQGFRGGDAPSRWGTRSLPANEGTLYACVWIRFSANWTHNGNVGLKLFSPRGLPGGENNHFVYFDAGEDDGLHPSFLAQYPDPSLNSFTGSASAANTISKGAWHRLEVLLVANTPGRRDGQLRLWIDGVRTVTSERMLFFMAGQAPAWGYLWFDPTYGGGAHPVPWPMWFDLDHIIVAIR